MTPEQAEVVRDAACSFCGKGSDEVRHLIAGPGVFICDGCVRVCYGIIEQLETPAPAAEDPVMAEIAEAQKLALEGEHVAAREAFAALWERIGDDGDPLHRVTLAHYMADAQTDPELELEWDLRALAAADSLTDERAQQYHATLAVRGLYPSLYLNLAADYEKLARAGEAREHLALAEARLADLPEGGYGDLIRSGVAELRHRLAS